MNSKKMFFSMLVAIAISFAFMSCGSTPAPAPKPVERKAPETTVEETTTAPVVEEETTTAPVVEEEPKFDGSFPQYYIVREWEDYKDCFWNIAGKPYIYNDPWMWQKLYEANKDRIPDPENPNIIEPGMKMIIPSVSGETRNGEYNPDFNYDTFQR